MQKQITLLSFIVALMALAPSAHAKIYKWTDENGKIHFGDRIPAKYTNSAHEQLSNSGKTIESVGRAKSGEELRAERLAQEAEEKRLKEERKAQLEQARQDQILLDTFSSERDITIMRDDRLSAIDSDLRLAESYNSQLRTQVEKTQNDINNFVKRKKPVPETLQQTIAGVQAQIDKNNEFVERKNQEKTEITEQFAKDLKRFKELRARRYGK